MAELPRFRLHHFETLASTQTEIGAGYKDGRYHAGDVVLCDTQTGGYGRRGRVWHSPQGNLYASFIESVTDYAQISWLGYAVGLGLYDAIKPLAPNAQISLKWPNDLLIDGGKLSGMLLEILDDGVVAVGIGMNVSVMPETDQKTAMLNNHTGVLYKPLEILQRFLPCYEQWHHQGIDNGFKGLKDAWLARAAFVGGPVKARLADGRVVRGTFADIDDYGALVLSTESGHHAITTADIYFNTE